MSLHSSLGAKKKKKEERVLKVGDGRDAEFVVIK